MADNSKQIQVIIVWWYGHDFFEAHVGNIMADNSQGIVGNMW